MVSLPQSKSPQSSPSSTTTTDSHQSTATVSNGTLIRRMLGLAWMYRWGCIKALLLQVGVLSFGLMGLGLFGLGVDIIQFHLDPKAKPPGYPFGLQPPPDTPILTIV